MLAIRYNTLEMCLLKRIGSLYRIIYTHYFPKSHENLKNKFFHNFQALFAQLARDFLRPIETFIDKDFFSKRLRRASSEQ